MKHIIDGILRSVIIAIFSVLVMCVTWQVFSRFVLGTPSTLTDEIARFLFMWLALIGGAYTFGMRRHLAIDLLTMVLQGRKRLAAEGAILLVVAVFAAVVMLWGGYSLVSRTLASGQVTPALRISMGWIYGAIPFAGAVILYYCALFFADIARGRLPDSTSDMPLE